MKTGKEILEIYPGIIKHHEYCMEMFILSHQYVTSWSCRCETLRDYDEWLVKNKKYFKDRGTTRPRKAKEKRDG